MTPHATLPSACGAALLTEVGRMTLGKRASLDRTLCLPLLPAPTRATPDPVIPKEAAPDYTWRKCTFCHYPPSLSHSYTHTHTPPQTLTPQHISTQLLQGPAKPFYLCLR